MAAIKRAQIPSVPIVAARKPAPTPLNWPPKPLQLAQGGKIIKLLVCVCLFVWALFKKKIPHTGDTESLDRCGS